MSPEALKNKIENLGPETQAEIMDLTGTGNHYKAVIVSPEFKGINMIKQHRLIFDLLKKELDSGEVHALTLKTFTPEEYRQLTGSN